MICKKCGKEIHDSATMCEYCGHSVRQDAPVQTAVPAVPAAEEVPIPTAAPEVKPQKPEKVAGGIVGAVIGALIGAASIILLSQMGYVASISGFVLAFCTLKGYELLGGQLSKKGVVVCIILTVITPYIADRASWAIAFAQAFSGEGISFLDWFLSIDGLIADGWIDSGEYIKNLLMLYGFAALGAFSLLRNAIKK